MHPYVSMHFAILHQCATKPKAFCVCFMFGVGSEAQAADGKSLIPKDKDTLQSVHTAHIRFLFLIGCACENSYLTLNIYILIRIQYAAYT